ncbi:MAG: hypothetical protein PHV30_02490 [Candidatus Margulisbacteria bacterium]|nr:hypothetical protein [Candidatus Margulisiibacteriota bacterium]
MIQKPDITRIGAYIESSSGLHYICPRDIVCPIADHPLWLKLNDNLYFNFAQNKLYQFDKNGFNYKQINVPAYELQTIQKIAGYYLIKNIKISGIIHDTEGETYYILNHPSAKFVCDKSGELFVVKNNQFEEIKLNNRNLKQQLQKVSAQYDRSGNPYGPNRAYQTITAAYKTREEYTLKLTEITKNDEPQTEGTHYPQKIEIIKGMETKHSQVNAINPSYHIEVIKGTNRQTINRKIAYAKPKHIQVIRGTSESTHQKPAGKSRGIEVIRGLQRTYQE